MRTTNKEFFETRAADFLQRAYEHYLKAEKFEGPESATTRAAWNYYQGAAEMLVAMGMNWDRQYRGDSKDKEQLNDIMQYRHFTEMPSSEKIKKLDIDLYKM